MSEFVTGTRLEGKVALISGGARGMGASHARAMVAQGAKLVLADVLDAEGEALAAELGDAAAYVHLDVTDRDQWAAAVQATVDRFGKLNVLVNNAGIANFGPIGHYPPQEWDRVIAINLTGVFNGIHASVEALGRRRPADHQHLVDGRAAGLCRAAGLQRRQVRRAGPDQVGGARSGRSRRALQLGAPRCGGHPHDGVVGDTAEARGHASGRPAGGALAADRVPGQRRVQLLHRRRVRGRWRQTAGPAPAR
ncbi:MAG: SDR family NAD(P)-dependent oxidoreductase [Acidimicrobiales bacterium]